MSRYILYFLLAAIPAVIAGAKEGMTDFAWWILSANALYQGLLAIKALQSQPKETPKPPVTNEPTI